MLLMEYCLHLIQLKSGAKKLHYEHILMNTKLHSYNKQSTEEEVENIL